MLVVWCDTDADFLDSRFKEAAVQALTSEGYEFETLTLADMQALSLESEKYVVILPMRNPEMLSNILFDCKRTMAILPKATLSARDACRKFGIEHVLDADVGLSELLAGIRLLMRGDIPLSCLIVEDDIEIATHLRESLITSGIQAQCCHALQAARQLISRHRFDAVICDRKLPDGDALELILQLRHNKIFTPVLLATALGSIEKRIEGLDAGADDYIAKPYATLEVIARIHALLRPRTRLDIVRYGALEMARKDCIIRWRGDRVALTDKEYKIFNYLAEREGITIPPSMLRADVWEQPFHAMETNVVATGVRRLRISLERSGVPDPIQTEREGYRFVVDPLLKLP